MKSLLFSIGLFMLSLPSVAADAPERVQTVSCVTIAPGLVAISTTYPESTQVVRLDLIESITGQRFEHSYWEEGRDPTDEYASVFSEDQIREQPAKKFHPLDGVSWINIRPVTSVNQANASGGFLSSNTATADPKGKKLRVPAAPDLLVAAIGKLHAASGLRTNLE